MSDAVIIKRKLNCTMLTVGLLALFVLSWGSFIFTPMAGDIKVFMANANQAHYISNSLIIGSFKAWELKSVVSRELSYLIYKIACIFVPYNTYSFEVVSKAIYSVLLILVVFISMKLSFSERQKVNRGTIVVSTLLMAMHTGCQMQVEMTATVFVLLAFSLYYNAVNNDSLKLVKLIGSGLLIGSLFYLKSVLILMSVSVVAAICIYNKECNRKLSIGRMMIVVAGSLISLGIIAAMILLINPSEFKDILDASAFQSTLFSVKLSLATVAKTFLGMHVRILYIPAVLLGALCFLLNLFCAIREKKWPLIFYHIVMWMMPALFILLSNKFFIYHFAAYLFPSLVEVYWVTIHWNKCRKSILGATAFLVAVLYIALFSLLSINVREYIKLDLQAYEKTNAFLKSVSFVSDQTTLYLDDGAGGYALGGPSHLKYFFPLPLQRLEEDSTLECHVTSLNEAMAFDGKYVSVYDEWFFTNGKYMELKEKIRNEYNYLGNYYVFSPPHSVYLPKVEECVREFELYEKKAE